MNDNEAKKEYLNRYAKQCAKIRALQDQERTLRAEMEGAKAIEYTDMPKGSLSQSDLSDYMIKLDAMMSRIIQAQKECEDILLEIIGAIADMKDGTESEVLHARYIDRLSWDAIANKMNYSARHVIRIHGNALLNFTIPERCHSMS